MMLSLLLLSQHSSLLRQCPSHQVHLPPPPTHRHLAMMNRSTRRWRRKTTSCPKRSFCAETRWARPLYVLYLGTVFKAMAFQSKVCLDVIVFHLFPLQGPVAVKVQVPNMQDKTEWKLSGQVLNFTVPLTDQVLSLLLTVRPLIFYQARVHCSNVSFTSYLRYPLSKSKSTRPQACLQENKSYSSR